MKVFFCSAASWLRHLDLPHCSMKDNMIERNAYFLAFFSLFAESVA
jgi:hypothetical protein